MAFFARNFVVCRRRPATLLRHLGFGSRRDVGGGASVGVVERFAVGRYEVEEQQQERLKTMRPI